jgi:hypothetical protein
MGANGERPGAGGLQALRRIGSSQTHQAQTGAVPLLGMRLLEQQSLDEFRRSRTDGGGPVQQATGRPFGMRPVSGRQVFRRGREMPAARAARMTGHPARAGQHFDRALRDAQFHFAVDEGMRHAVIAAVEFDVIVDIDPRALPFSEREGCRRQGPQVGRIEQGEGRGPAAGQFLEGARIQFRQQRRDRRIGLVSMAVKKRR